MRSGCRAFTLIRPRASFAPTTPDTKANDNCQSYACPLALLMCGICGIAHAARDRPVDREALQRMCDMLAHRGPDGAGAHVEAGVGLGHRRLSIIDVAGGAQPLSNEDGTVWVSFNGEIHNHRELATRLAGMGHTFRTHSDTEVRSMPTRRGETPSSVS